jgi:dihydrofolate synthase / folylpolyglutamate synthase
VVEVGLGGRLDATNIVEARSAVITTVELEHTDILGPTLGDVAREKAGILKPGQHAVLGRLPPEARAEIDRRAYAAGIPAWHLDEEVRVADRSLSEKGQTLSVELPYRSYARLKLPLQGSFQPGNAALAVAAANRFLAAEDRTLSEAAARRGVAAVVWRGRLERLDRAPDLFLDVAHTPESAQALAESLGEIAPLAPREESAILFGCLAEKSFGAILETLAPLAETLVVVPVRSSRSAAPGDLRRAATGLFPRIVEAPGAAEGLKMARIATGPDGFTLVTGSDYLAGELLADREGADDDEPDLSDPGQTPVEREPAEALGRRSP